MGRGAKHKALQRLPPEGPSLECHARAFFYIERCSMDQLVAAPFPRHDLDLDHLLHGSPGRRWHQLGHCRYGRERRLAVLTLEARDERHRVLEPADARHELTYPLDQVIRPGMPTPRHIQISEFKARCIEALRDVDRTRRPLIVTLRGKPIAVVEPVSEQRALGTLQGECVIHGDLVAGDFDAEWEMNR